MSRLLPGTDLRVRRGRREDLAQVQVLLGEVTASPRHLRRAVADLGADLYVAEDPQGEIVGLVSVTYARSLVRGGRAAVLDGVRARQAPAGPVLVGLVTFAEERARKRGCLRLAAWVDATEDELRATLLARGYHPGALLAVELERR